MEYVSVGNEFFDDILSALYLTSYLKDIATITKPFMLDQKSTIFNLHFFGANKVQILVGFDQ